MDLYQYKNFVCLYYSVMNVNMNFSWLMYLFIVCITESIFGWNEWCDASSCHLFELEKMMFMQEGRRIGRPPASKKRRQIGFGGGLVCPSCCRRRVDGVCGCAGNAAQAVVASEEE